MNSSSWYENYRKWSARISQLANSGIPRAAFLEEAFRSALDWLKCDAVRAVLLSQQRRVFCEITAGASHEFIFKVSERNKTGPNQHTWSASKGDSLETICRDIFTSRTRSSLPWFTDQGSLWIEDRDNFPDSIRSRSGKIDGPGLKIPSTCRSMMIIPVDGAQGRIGLLQLESSQAVFFAKNEIAQYERLAQTLGFALSWRNIQVALRERVKELTCLYGITRLVAHANSSLDEVLQRAVELLPPAWLYPNVAAAKIELDGVVYATPGADNIAQDIKADIIIDNVKRGSVQVGYTAEKPLIDEGPFLTEERSLIDTIAGELSFIIEQRLYNEEKSRLRDQLRHADRLATIGQLAAGVAHELNEPLSNILGFAQLIAKDTGLSDQSVKDADRIVGATLHARQIIKELLIFARETEPVKITFSLNELIRDGLFFLESRFKKVGIDLDCDLAPDIPNVKADRLQILQVLTNLVVNSVQAMPSGGRLTIRTVSEDGFVELAVTDTGVGIDNRIIDKIFNPFFTTKDVSEGTGLGLSVVHGIVTAHNGTVSVESRRGKGSTFSVRLPVENEVHKTEDPSDV